MIQLSCKCQGFVNRGLSLSKIYLVVFTVKHVVDKTSFQILNKKEQLWTHAEVIIHRKCSWGKVLCGAHFLCTKVVRVVLNLKG